MPGYPSTTGSVVCIHHYCCCCFAWLQGGTERWDLVQSVDYSGWWPPFGSIWEQKDVAEGGTDGAGLGVEQHACKSRCSLMHRSHEFCGEDLLTTDNYCGGVLRAAGRLILTVTTNSGHILDCFMVRVARTYGHAQQPARLLLYVRLLKVRACGLKLSKSKGAWTAFSIWIRKSISAHILQGSLNAIPADLRENPRITWTRTSSAPCLSNLRTLLGCGSQSKRGLGTGIVGKS
jgi:hypothetical protein